MLLLPLKEPPAALFILRNFDNSRRYMARDFRELWGSATSEVAIIFDHEHVGLSNVKGIILSECSLEEDKYLEDIVAQWI